MSNISKTAKDAGNLYQLLGQVTVDFMQSLVAYIAWQPLASLERSSIDLVMYYNILHGFVDIDAGSLFDTINCNVIRSRGHPIHWEL